SRNVPSRLLRYARLPAAVARKRSRSPSWSRSTNSALATPGPGGGAESASPAETATSRNLPRPSFRNRAGPPPPSPLPRTSSPGRRCGYGQVLIEGEDGITHESAARASPPQALEADLVGGGDFHGAMEPLRLSRRVRRATRASELESALEKPRGLARQLGELPLQRLELPGRVGGGAAREQQVHELEPRGDVRRSAGRHPSQQGLLTLPLVRIGRAPGELRERVQRPDVRGIAPEHALDFTARLRPPPGQL